MENLETLDAHRQGIARLVPILDAVRSVAELAWRRAEQGFRPLAQYGDGLGAMFARALQAVDREERESLVNMGAATRAVGLLVVSSERGLCGPFNERLVQYALEQTRVLAARGQSVQYLCLGSRGRRLLEARGLEILYARPSASLSVPSYVDIQAVALDLLDLAARGAFGRLLVVHNHPVRRFQYGPSSLALLPPDIRAEPLPAPRVAVKPTGDIKALLTHLLTEHLLVGLTRVVLESVMSEQLARVYTMRLAADNARRLVGRLTLEYNLARRNAITSSLLEIVAGYEATRDHAPSPGTEGRAPLVGGTDRLPAAGPASRGERPDAPGAPGR